jgi:hypothetical protein
VVSISTHAAATAIVAALVSTRAFNNDFIE